MASMQLITTAHAFIEYMVSAVEGPKILLLDEDTMASVSIVFSRTEFTQKQVLHYDLLSNKERDPLKHLRCVVFVRPTEKNIADLQEELRATKYSRYSLCFTNIVDRDILTAIADADDEQVVTAVGEYFYDFHAVNHNLFSLEIPATADLMAHPSASRWHRGNFERIIDGVTSVLLALKKRPTMRFQDNSPLCRKISAEVKDRIQKEKSLYSFKQSDCLLLILDRKEDPLTPILTPWTYQAMVHELFGIRHNRAVLPDETQQQNNPDQAQSSNAAPQPQPRGNPNEYIFSEESDEYYRANMYRNYGELCDNLRAFVATYQEKNSSTQDLKSIGDLQKFINSLPEFRRLGGSVNKHVNVMSAINRELRRRKLFEVSVLEQDLACRDRHKEHYEELTPLLQDPEVLEDDALRLALLYALRYQTDKSNHIKEVKEALHARNIPASRLDLIDTCLKQCGSEQRALDLYGGGGIFNSIVGNFVRGLDVKNIFTQHQPLLNRILQDIVKGKLQENHFPYETNMHPPGKDWRPREIIVFYAGGVTYEEALVAEQFKGASVVLGGSGVINSNEFLHELEALAGDARSLV